MCILNFKLMAKRYSIGKLPDLHEGDSFPLIQIRSAESLSGWAVKAEITQLLGLVIRKKLTLVSVTGGFDILPFVENMGVGAYTFRLQFTSPDGFKTTSFEGKFSIVRSNKEIETNEIGVGLNVTVLESQIVKLDVTAISIGGGGPVEWDDVENKPTDLATTQDITDAVTNEDYINNIVDLVLAQIPTDPSGPDPDEPLTFGRTIELTPVSGQLIFDGSSAGLQDKDLYLIPAGTYNYVDIKNIIMPSGQRVYFKNNGGVVNITGNGNNLNLTDVNGLTLIGNGQEGVEYGFTFTDNNGRAIFFRPGIAKNITLKYTSFANIGDYNIWDENNNRVYDPENNDTVMENIKFSHLLFDNNGNTGIALWGQYGNNFGSGTTFAGMKRNIVCENIKFRNSDAGTMIKIDIVEDADIDHCDFSELNPTNNAHNGIVFITGNGKLHHSKCVNHQGNMLRGWCCNFSESAGKWLEVYHNKVYNSRKYGGFETSPQPDMYNNPALYHPCNIRVYNNTVIKMDTSGDPYQGRLIDFYNNPGATIEFFNNLGAELDDNQLINFASGTDLSQFTVNQNNLVFATAAEAVNNTTDLISLHPGVGAVI